MNYNLPDDKFTRQMSSDRMFLCSFNEYGEPINVGLIKYRDGVCNCYPIIEDEVEWGTPVAFSYPNGNDAFDYTFDLEEKFFDECEREIRQYYADIDQWENYTDEDEEDYIDEDEEDF